MTADGLESLYFNSGAFGFPRRTTTYSIGWIGPDDPTIRPDARAMIRAVAPPWEENLTALALQIWREHLPGDVWVMPKSHWGFELDHGSAEWMPAALKDVEIDSSILASRTDGSAIEFTIDEAVQFEKFLHTLLTRLMGSDFLIAFPDRGTICTVHHHRQLWWTTTDEKIHAAIDAAVKS